MRDFDSADILHAGTQLSAFSGRLLGLFRAIDSAAQALEHAETSANSNVSRMARADLLSALELQKQVIGRALCAGPIDAAEAGA